MAQSPRKARPVKPPPPPFCETNAPVRPTQGVVSAIFGAVQQVGWRWLAARQPAGA